MRHTGNDDISGAAREEGRKRLAEGLRAGIYCRISRAADGDFTKTDDQERISRDQAGQLGWTVIDVYTDHSKSAWQPGRKRKEWDRMLGDIDAGRINAIIVYHGDRLIGRPEDLATLLGLSRSRGIRLASPTGDRDLSNPDDEFVMWIEAAMKGRESANLSRRRKSQYERWRREGRVFAGGHGGRRFGYMSSGLELYPPCRCDAATREEHSEAQIIREAAGRTLAGESAYAIVKDLTARGWRTPAGRRMRDTGLRELLANPRYAGLMPDGEGKGAWPAILERETWERLQPLVRTRARPPVRTRWLLSGIAVCGRCGQLMDIAHVKSRGYKTTVYGCRRDGGCAKVWRNAEHLDAYVSARVVRLLNDPRQPEGQLPVRADDAPEWEALTRERADTEALAADYVKSAGRTRLLLARLDRIDARIAELRDRESADARSRLLGSYRGIAAEGFRDLPLDVRRALTAASYRITVLPSSKRGPGFRTEDVRLDPA